MPRLYRLVTFSARHSKNYSIHAGNPLFLISDCLRHVQCRAGLLRARKDRSLRHGFDRALRNGHTAILLFEEQSPVPFDDLVRAHTVGAAPVFQNGQHSPGSEVVARRQSSLGHVASASSGRPSWTHALNTRASLLSSR